MSKVIVLLLILAVVAGLVWLLSGGSRKIGRHSRSGSLRPATGTRTTLQLAPGASQLEKMRESHLFWGVSLQNPGCDAAMELFEKDPLAFDLVITDMIMPGMTGEVVAEKILAIRPDLPIILATGYSEQMNETKAKTMGIAAFTLKPLVMESLARLIRKVLEKNH